MKLLTILFFAVAAFGRLLADAPDQDAKNVILHALRQKDSATVMKLIGNAKDFQIYGIALDNVQRNRDVTMSKVIVKAGLGNPNIWQEPGLEPGELAAARDTIKDVTCKQLAALGVKATEADLEDTTRRARILSQLR
jgi:hypothetical protein